MPGEAWRKRELSRGVHFASDSYAAKNKSDYTKSYDILAKTLRQQFWRVSQQEMNDARKVRKVDGEIARV